MNEREKPAREKVADSVISSIEMLWDWLSAEPPPSEKPTAPPPPSAAEGITVIETEGKET